jgi:hypothetical protein
MEATMMMSDLIPWGRNRTAAAPRGNEETNPFLGHHPPLHLLGKELRAPVSLDALDGEGHLVQNLVEEGQGRCRAKPATR